MKKVQDPLKFSWLIACSPSEPWQPGISSASGGSRSKEQPHLQQWGLFWEQS